jgi:hypothetical protein
MRWSQESAAAAWMDLGIVMESEEPRAPSGCFVLMLQPSGLVGLDRPPPGDLLEASLVAKASGLRG